MHNEEKILTASPTLVLLIDSDGTIFKGNMKNVISSVIKFLKKEPASRKINQLLDTLEDDLPIETEKLLIAWLETQKNVTIPWATADGELLDLQQTIATFFPLIQFQDSSSDAKPYTAIDIFNQVWERQGKVIILTFNTYAPATIRHALIQKGLALKKAQRISIICPGNYITSAHEGIYGCTPPDEGPINKNSYIREAQRLCENEFKLDECQFIFADDQHARAAQLLRMNIEVVTEGYTHGQHLKKILALINPQMHSTPVSKPSTDSSDVFDIMGEDDSAPHLKLPIHRDSNRISTLELPPTRKLSSSSFSFTPPTMPSSSSSPPAALTLLTDSPPTFTGSARLEQLEQNLNPAPISLIQSERSSEESVEGEELALMYPHSRSIERNFWATYHQANNYEDKINIITHAIKHFYPQTQSGASSHHPQEELQQWINNFDELFASNLQKQNLIIQAAIDCWTELQPSLAGTGSPQILRNNWQFLSSSAYGEEKPPSTPSSLSSNLAATELQKWRQHQTALNTSSRCCLIL